MKTHSARSAVFAFSLMAFCFAAGFSGSGSASDGHGANDHHPHADVAAFGAAEALKMLQAGNERFVYGKTLHPRQDPPTRAELANGQKPHSIILSCSDSRVGPEIIFDQGLGHVFSVRSAGQFLEPGGLASIEYAIEHLGSRLILVLGHESCGAIKAAVSTPAGADTGSTNLNQLVWGLQLNLREQQCVHQAEDKKYREPVKANVQAQAAQLLRESKIVSEFAEKGELKIFMGIYCLESGKVEFWNLSKGPESHALSSGATTHK